MYSNAQHSHPSEEGLLGSDVVEYFDIAECGVKLLVHYHVELQQSGEGGREREGGGERGREEEGEGGKERWREGGKEEGRVGGGGRDGGREEGEMEGGRDEERSRRERENIPRRYMYMYMCRFYFSKP